MKITALMKFFKNIKLCPFGTSPAGRQPRSWRRIFIISASITVVTTLTVGAFYFGLNYGKKQPEMVLVQGVSNIEGGIGEKVDFNNFWKTWNIIKSKYVDAGKTNNQDLVYGAISGLFKALDDPNSTFMPPSDAKRFGEDISGEFGGIGAEIGIRNEQLVVIAPLKDTPAEQAGLRSGDKILKIDDKTTNNLTVEEAVKLIRGEKGKTVVLTILRNGWDKSKDIPIVRDVIQIPTLDLETKEGNIAYIHLYNFYENAPFLFYKAAVEVALNKEIKGIILDLRDNPGGYLNGAVNIAGWFFEPGEIVVSEEFRAGTESTQVFKSSGNGFFKNTPIVVLMNQGSASASEILAGALRDNRGIKLIGKHSFGKGTVQEVQNLNDGSIVKITVAHWLLPKGQVIEKNGLAPDYEVDLTDEDIKAEKDPQMDKAMEILKREFSI
ncbi:MAG: S41 family peptidase [Patescibacteria group bacterium]